MAEPRGSGGPGGVSLVSACRHQNGAVPPNAAPSTGPRLAALFAAGLLLLNWPLLALWDRGLAVGGWPLLPTAVFVGWAVLIAAAAWICESDATDD